MVNLSGKWVIAKHDNLDAVIVNLKIPADQRPDQPITSMTTEINQDGDNFEIRTTGENRRRDSSRALL